MKTEQANKNMETAKPISPSELSLHDRAYLKWIADLKRRYHSTQIKASLAVNSTLLEFYWSLGKDISEKYPGKKRNVAFYDRLSHDLRVVLPNSAGLSPINLRYTQRFYELYANLQQFTFDNDNLGKMTIEQSSNNSHSMNTHELRQHSEDKRNIATATSEHYLQQPVEDNDKLGKVPAYGAHSGKAENMNWTQIKQMLVSLPWGHHVTIIDKCGGDVNKALFYIRKALENHWSRKILVNWLSTNLYEREGKAISNYQATLPFPEGDLAQQLTKDPYIFNVQGLAEKYNETQIKRAMTENIEKLLLEMGKGFAFVGREVIVNVAGQEK